MLCSLLIPLLALAQAAFPSSQNPVAAQQAAQTEEAAQTQEAVQSQAPVQPTTETEQVEEGQISVAGKTLSYRIRRLPLSAFPELPVAIRRALEQRHCTVPQSYQARRPENVIHRHFLERDSDDWAVLCSSQGMTTLIVFNSSAVNQPTEFASERDTERLSPTGPTGDLLGYNRGIDAASPERVRELAGRTPGKFDHDGIEDSTVDHVSTIHYYQGGDWIEVERAP